MEQLRMNWKNDKNPCVFPTLPEDITVRTFTELTDALAAWQDIMRYLAKDGDLQTDGNYYKEAMLDYPNYDENMCYFLLVDDKPAATLAVICDYEKKQGYIHMVASKPEFRGKGLGHLLNSIAVYTLKREGMETAYLTTDDWRLAAIKTYLKAGFEPDTETEPDYKERWAKIYSDLQNHSK